MDFNQALFVHFSFEIQIPGSVGSFPIQLAIEIRCSAIVGVDTVSADLPVGLTRINCPEQEMISAAGGQRWPISLGNNAFEVPDSSRNGAVKLLIGTEIGAGSNFEIHLS